MLINLLGIDGIGKTTHVKKLKEEIRKNFSLQVRVITKSDIMDSKIFPEADLFRVPYSVLAIECLPYMKGNSRSMWLLYMFSVIFGKFPPKDNEIIILDGFWQKHYASETSLGVNGDWFKQVCNMFPEVDYTILLDANPESILKRSKKQPTPYECGLDTTCSKEAFITHQNKMRSTFSALMEEGYKHNLVDAESSLEKVFKQIKELVFKELKDMTKKG